MCLKGDGFIQEHKFKRVGISAFIALFGPFSARLDACLNPRIQTRNINPIDHFATRISAFHTPEKKRFRVPPVPALTSSPVKASAQIYRHPYRVTYADCTVGDHVYYSRYFDMLEAARGEFLRSLGFSLKKLDADGLSLPVIRCAGKFLAAARYDDVLNIELSLQSLGRIKMEFTSRILSETGQLLFEGTTEHACVDRSAAPTRVPEAFSRELTAFLRPSVSPS